MHEKSKRFHEILAELGRLHDEKQRAYGTDEDPFANIRASKEFNVAPWLGAVLRANDKMARLKAFASKGEVPFESVEDSLRDLAVYAIISIIMLEEANDNAPTIASHTHDYTVQTTEQYANCAVCEDKSPDNVYLFGGWGVVCGL